MNTQVKLITANMILVDRFLEQYGPGARVPRELLRKTVDPMVDRIWGDSASATAVPFVESPEAQAACENIQKLSPGNELESLLKARAIQVLTDLAQERLSLFTQADSSKSNSFPGNRSFLARHYICKLQPIRSPQSDCDLDAFRLCAIGLCCYIPYLRNGPAILGADGHFCGSATSRACLSWPLILVE